MKIAVVGAGAVGGFLAATLARAGHDVTAIARGAHLEAIRRNGLKVVGPDGIDQIAANVRAVQHVVDAGPQDVVMLTLKAHQIVSVAHDLPVLTTPSTCIVAIQNGIPWWYFQKHGGPFDGRVVESVDPGGTLAVAIDADRLVGSVVYAATEVIAPGVIRHFAGNRFMLGELDGAETPRIQGVATALIQAGLSAPVSRNIRADIWLKLWGNVAFNPISALTHATLADIARFPPARASVAAVMAEAEAVARKLGVEFPVSVAERIAGAESVGGHKTSMLQDIEAGRPIELEALVGAVLELGRLTQTPTPHIETVYACAGLLAKTLVHENGRLKIESVKLS
jgi:2-dehydropantoate 2-reductase